MTARGRSRLPALLAAIALVAAACSSSGGPILAVATAPRPSIAPPSAPPAVVADPQPVELPRDDGPHHRLTEWWYYTGHLRATSGVDGSVRRFGFEFVIFRAERGTFPVTWASHLALTDETGDAFHYGQRAEIGPAVDRSPRGVTGETVGFDLSLTGLDAADPTTAGRAPWSMRGADGTDHLTAAMAAAEASPSGAPGAIALDLALQADKPAALHDTDGWIDFGPAGGSYYYSRTSMPARGTITVDGSTLAVIGDAWFDHQWGDFISVGGGGWDWFAVNLDDDTDLTLSLVRDADGSYPLVYGTLVDAAGRTTHLDRDAFSVETDAEWTSPSTGATYPAGWLVTIPEQGLRIHLTPTVAAQELDTRATTGVVYWEGSQEVRATRGGQPMSGQAYVELTGYAPTTVAAPAKSAAPAP